MTKKFYNLKSAREFAEHLELCVGAECVHTWSERERQTGVMVYIVSWSE